MRCQAQKISREQFSLCSRLFSIHDTCCPWSVMPKPPVSRPITQQRAILFLMTVYSKIMLESRVLAQLNRIFLAKRSIRIFSMRAMCSRTERAMCGLEACGPVFDGGAIWRRGLCADLLFAVDLTLDKRIRNVYNK